MGITLIITKSVDQNFKQTGERIAVEDWLGIVHRDPVLSLRTDPYVTRLPNGREVRAPVLAGQSEFVVSGERVAFLGYRSGELVMEYTEDLEDTSNPQRQKVAEIA